MASVFYQEQGKASGLMFSLPKDIRVEGAQLVLENKGVTYSIDTTIEEVAQELLQEIEKALESEKNYNIYSKLYQLYITTDFDLTKVRLTVHE